MMPVQEYWKFVRSIHSHTQYKREKSNERYDPLTIIVVWCWTDWSNRGRATSAWTFTLVRILKELYYILGLSDRYENELTLCYEVPDPPKSNQVSAHYFQNSMHQKVSWHHEPNLTTSVDKLFLSQQNFVATSKSFGSHQTFLKLHLSSTGSSSSSSNPKTWPHKWHFRW